MVGDDDSLPLQEGQGLGDEPCRIGPDHRRIRIQSLPVRFPQVRVVPDQPERNLLEDLLGLLVPEGLPRPGMKRDIDGGFPRYIPETPFEQHPVAGFVGQTEGQFRVWEVFRVPRARWDESSLHQRREIHQLEPPCVLGRDRDRQVPVEQPADRVGYRPGQWAQTQPAARSQLPHPVGRFPDQESPTTRGHRPQVPGHRELSRSVVSEIDVQPDPDRFESDLHVLESLARDQLDSGVHALTQERPAQWAEVGQGNRGRGAVGVLMTPREPRHLQQNLALRGFVVHPPVIRDDVQPAGLGFDPALFPEPQGTQHQSVRLLQWTVDPELQAEFDGPPPGLGCGQQPGQRVLPGGRRENGLHRRFPRGKQHRHGVFAPHPHRARAGAVDPSVVVVEERPVDLSSAALDHRFDGAGAVRGVLQDVPGGLVGTSPQERGITPGSSDGLVADLRDPSCGVGTHAAPP